MSVAGMAMGQRSSAMRGLKRASDLDEARENAEDTLDMQQKQAQVTSGVGGAGVGAGIAFMAGAGPVGIVTAGILGGLAGFGLAS